jgi:hypothetical protein
MICRAISGGEESFLPKLGGKSHANICLVPGRITEAAPTRRRRWRRRDSRHWLQLGRVLGSTAKTLADNTANSAVVATIAPICVDQFQRSADAASNLTALQKTSSYEQAAYVEKGGWAIMPGSKAVDSGVPQACAAILSGLK